MENLMSFYDFELGAIANELSETLTPSVISMQVIQLIIQMQIEMADFIKKNGKSDRAEKSARRLMDIYSLMVKLNSFTGEMNAMKLRNREIIGKYKLLIQENIELKRKLKTVEDAENY